MLAEGTLEKTVSEFRIPTLTAGEREQETARIRASQKGDAGAFNQLVLCWERSIYNLCLRMLQDPEEASEVTQEVFMDAFRGIRRFRLHSRFSTWLYRIAANACLTRLRKRPHTAHVSLDDGGHALERRLRHGQNQEQALLEREKRERIGSALLELSPSQRLVVELKIYQDRKFEEIAEIVDAPLGTVKSRFYSSLEILRGSLAHFS